MGSQTYVEDFESSYKSTWTISFSSSSEYNVTTPNETLTISSPTVTAKYVGSGKGYAVVDISGSIYDEDPVWGGGNFLANWKRYRGTIKNGNTQQIATTSGTTYTLSVGGTFIGSNDATFNVTASSLFNENNSLERYVYLWAVIQYGILESSDSSYDHYNAYPNYGWGQLYDNSMTAIRIDYRCPPSVTIGSPSYANPQYAGFGAYSVPLTRLAAEYGGKIASVKLTVGADSTTQTYSTNTVTNKTISVVPSTAGESITPVLEVTDSRGVVSYQSLTAIDVLEYDKPSVNFDVYRTDNDGKKSDEGSYAIIDAQVTFTSGAVTIKEKPTVIIDGTDKTSNVTWYPNWTASGGKSGNEITTWSSVSSGSHIYGLINGNFSETLSYSVTMKAKDTSNKVSDPITQTLSTAFYTIDFQAGGKEIAFGAPANDDITNYPDGLFKCRMNFVDMKLVGEIKAYAGSTVPNGWLLCDGSEVAVSSYPLLYAAIGNLWGTPSDNDHFVLPNLNGKIPVGYDSTDTDFDTVGESGGVKTHTHTTGNFTLGTDHIPAHTHGSKTLTGATTANVFMGNQTASSTNGIVTETKSSNRQYSTNGTTDNSWKKISINATHTHTSVGGGQAHNHGATGDGSNLQPYAVVKYIICAA